MWGRYCCLTSYFYPCLSCEDISRVPTTLCDGAQMAIFWRPVFSVSRMQHVSDLHPKFALKPHHTMCGSMVYIQYASAESMRETCWNLLGCPKLTKRSQPLVGRSSPYCKDMWGRYCCLTSFFQLSIRMRALFAKIWPDKVCDGAQMAILAWFLRPVFSDMHSKFALRPHHVWKYGRQKDIQSPTAKIRRGKKDRKKESKNINGKNIMACPVS